MKTSERHFFRAIRWC